MTGTGPIPSTPSPTSPGVADDHARHAAHLEEALFEVKRVIVGQDRMVERAMICLLARGHCLIEGVPGLAKTLTVSTMSQVIGGAFTRVQFTPDLVPADIVGTRVWRPSREEFDIEWGPIFANLVLADEINRAPAKVQSALLEVMAERHVSIAGQTRALPDAVPRARDAEPDRVRRRVRAARSAARPLPHADRGGTAVVRRRDRDRAPHGRDARPRPSRCSASSSSIDAAAGGRRRVRAPRGAGLRRPSRDGDARARRLGCSRHRGARRSRCEPTGHTRAARRPGARSRCCAAAGSSRRRTCSTSHPRSCVTV